MHTIASTAVSFALLGSVAGTNLAHKNVNTTGTKPPTVPSKVVTAAPAAKPAPILVVVQAGDTLNAIAEAHGTTYVRIFDANDSLSDPDVIIPGQQLFIPADNEQLPDRMATLTPDPTAAYSTPAVSAVRRSSSSGASVPVVGNDAKAFIYSHESGNNPNATSPSGCYGLGQDCNGRVAAQCGADYACQDAYFTNYATSRYGSWEAAAAFWQTHGWW